MKKMAQHVRRDVATSVSAARRENKINTRRNDVVRNDYILVVIINHGARRRAPDERGPFGYLFATIQGVFFFIGHAYDALLFRETVGAGARGFSTRVFAGPRVSLHSIRPSPTIIVRRRHCVVAVAYVSDAFRYKRETRHRHPPTKRLIVVSRRRR